MPLLLLSWQWLIPVPLMGWWVDRRPLGYYCDVTWGLWGMDAGLTHLVCRRGPLFSTTCHMIILHISTGSDFSPSPFHSRKSHCSAGSSAEVKAAWMYYTEPWLLCVRPRAFWSGWGFTAYPGGIYSCAVVVHNRLWVTAPSTHLHTRYSNSQKQTQHIMSWNLGIRFESCSRSLMLSGLIKVYSL